MILNIGYSLWTLLSRLSGPDLGQMAHRVGLSKAKPTLEEVHLAAGEPGRVDRALVGLSGPAQELLVAMYLRGGTLAQEDVHHFDHAVAHLRELAGAGLVFMLRNHYFGAAYAVPMDYGPALFHRLIAPRIPSDLTHADRSPRREARYLDWFPFFHDLFQVLSFARTEPIALTQQGQIYKRAEKQIVSRLWPGIEDPPAVTRFYTAIEFAQLHRLMGHDPEQNRLVVHPSAADQYWALSIVDRALTWFTYAYEHGPAVYLRPLLGLIAARIPEDAFIDLRAFNDWLRAYHVPAPHLDYMERLRTLGLWEGNTSRGRLTDMAYWAVRRQFAELTPAGAILQPTGEVLLPPTVPFSERWSWDAFTSLSHSDRMVELKLDHRGLERAMDLDWTLDDVLEAAESLSKSGLPDNVRANLRDWWKALNRHRVLEVTVIHSESAQDSRMVEKRLGTAVVERLSEHDLIIRPDRTQAALKTLQKVGIAIRDRIERPGTESPLPDDAAWVDYRPYIEPYGLNVVTLLPLAGSLPDPGEIRRRVESAIRDRRPLIVTYQASAVVGQPSEQRREQIVPFSLREGWIQATIVGRDRFLSLHLNQLLKVEEDG